MINQLVPKELLEKSDKILFIGGIAVGDFCYMHNYFKALSKQYPNLKIDLWLDEYRGQSLLFRWKSLGADIVHEWLNSCGFFNRVYKSVGAWWNVLKLFKQLRQERYPIIVCLFTVRQKRSAIFAKIISPKGCIVREYAVQKAVDAQKFDFVADVIAYKFNKFIGIELSDSQKKMSFDIDEVSLANVRTKFLEWGIENQQDRIVFLNVFAKSKKRCWDITSVIELIKKMKQEKMFSNASFIINSMPDKKQLIESLVKNNFFEKVYVFTVSNGFFELPAIISLCDLVVSVDTSVVHLAHALNIPLVGLFRQKSIWAPKSDKSFFVYTKNKNEWTNDILVDAVFKCITDVPLEELKIKSV